MTKYIVFKKVSAYEMHVVEGDSTPNAIENIMEGKGIESKEPLAFFEDCDPDTWIVEPLVATDQELDIMRSISLPYATEWETGKGDEQC